MNKKLVCLAALLLLCAMLASCSAPVCATLLTGGEGGTYYTIGNALSELLGSNEDKNGDKDDTKFTATFDVYSSSGYKENISKLSAGECQMAIVRNDIAYYALNGNGIFSEKYDGFSLVCELYNEAVHIVAKTGTGSVSSLEGMTVAVGEEGSATELIANAVLGAGGVTTYYKKNLSTEASAEALKNGEIDAFIFVSGIASSVISNLANEFTFELLGLEAYEVEKLCTEYPFFKECTILKKSYSVLKSSIHTVTLRACLLAYDDMDEELVYNIAKRFAEDSELLNHKKYTELSPDLMWVNTCLPIHKGADEYREDYEKEKAEKESNKTTKAPETTASPEVDTEEEDNASD